MLLEASRRRFVTIAALAAAPRVLLAQTAYPSRPVRWIVPYPAGGGSDFLARTVSTPLATQLGQPIVIDNRPGAATMIGAEATAKSTADGYTVMSADNGTLVFNAALYRKLPYDPVKDFAFVGLMARFPLLLVANPAAGFRNAKDVVAAFKAQPGKLSYASPGAGSPHHLAMELFKQRTGTFVLHIPYRGAAPAVQDVLGNQVPLMVIDTAVGLPYVRGEKLVALGVFANKRLASLPSIPTLSEQGIADTEVYAWQGLVAPTGTPREIIGRLTSEMQRAIAQPETTRKLIDFGLEPTPGGADEMAAYVKSEIGRWHALIRERHLTLE